MVIEKNGQNNNLRRSSSIGISPRKSSISSSHSDNQLLEPKYTIENFTKITKIFNEKLSEISSNSKENFKVHQQQQLERFQPIKNVDELINYYSSLNSSNRDKIKRNSPEFPSNIAECSRNLPHHKTLPETKIMLDPNTTSSNYSSYKNKILTAYYTKETGEDFEIIDPDNDENLIKRKKPQKFAQTSTEFTQEGCSEHQQSHFENAPHPHLRRGNCCCCCNCNHKRNSPVSYKQFRSCYCMEQLTKTDNLQHNGHENHCTNATINDEIIENKLQPTRAFVEEMFRKYYQPRETRMCKLFCRKERRRSIGIGLTLDGETSTSNLNKARSNVNIQETGRNRVEVPAPLMLGTDFLKIVRKYDKGLARQFFATPCSSITNYHGKCAKFHKIPQPFCYNYNHQNDCHHGNCNETELNLSKCIEKLTELTRKISRINCGEENCCCCCCSCCDFHENYGNNGHVSFEEVHRATEPIEELTRNKSVEVRIPLRDVTTSTSKIQLTRFEDIGTNTDIPIQKDYKKRRNCCCCCCCCRYRKICQNPHNCCNVSDPHNNNYAYLAYN